MTKVTGLRDQLLKIARDYAALPPFEAPCLSVYLNTQWGEPSQREKVRIFLKNEFAKLKNSLPDSHQFHQYFQEAEIKINNYVFGELPENTRGLIVFACQPKANFNAFPLPVSFNLQVISSDRPYLRPLVRAVDENKTALVVHLHVKKGEIYEISMGEMSAAHLVTSEVPQKVFAGGWSQMRFQRHVEAHIRDHLTEIADFLTKIFDRDQIKYVYLFAPEEVATAFQDRLPKRVRLATHFEGGVTPEAKTRLLHTKVIFLLSQQERLEEATKIKALSEIRPPAGRGTLGIDQTLAAVNQTAVQELLISNNYVDHGWQCLKCQIFGKIITDRCPNCDCPVIKVNQLDNAIVGKVLVAGGKIEEIIDNEEFDRRGGIGAFLRFPLT